MAKPSGLPLPALVHMAIRKAFLARGGNPDQWDRVNADPRKFNTAWNRLLGLPSSDKPPAQEYRKLDPQTFADLETGEILPLERMRVRR